jgi:uncharacterized membrane protein
MLVGLLILLLVLRATVSWPDKESQNVVLIGVLLLSITPILLALVAVIIERGAVIGYAGVTIDFSKVPQFRWFWVLQFLR